MDILTKIEHASKRLAEAQEILDSAKGEVYQVYKKWAKAMGRNPINECDLVEIRDEDDRINLEFEVRYCGCCPPEMEYADIDKKFFTNFDEAVAEYEADQKRRAQLEKEEKEKRLATLAKIKEQKERAELAKLKKKYPEA